MTQLIKKRLLKIGPGAKYHAPQREFDASDMARARRWVSKFKELKSKGFLHPIPWGHRQSAIPTPGTVSDDEMREAMERRMFEEARYNAGFIEDLEIEDGPDGKYLTMTMPLPAGHSYCPQTGTIINPTDGTSVREVSGAWGDLRTGDGKLHKDILIHAALCTKAVWSGQDGFQLSQPTTLSAGLGSVEYTFTCSLGGSSMAADKKKKKPEDDIDAAPSPMDEDEPYEPEMEDEPAPDVAPVDVATPETDVDAVDTEASEPALAAPVEEEPMDTVGMATGPDKVKELIRVLAEMKIALPASIKTCDELVDNLLTVLTAFLGHQGSFTIADEDQGAAAQPATATTGEPAPTAEPPPVPTMMSLSSVTDPRLRKAYERDQSAMRKEHSTLCKKIKKLGCPVFIADELAGESGLVMLSLTSKGEPKTPASLKALRLLHRVLKNMSNPTMLSLATAVETPIQRALKHENQQHKPEEDVMAVFRRGAQSGLGQGGRLPAVSTNGKH